MHSQEQLLENRDYSREKTLPATAEPQVEIHANSVWVPES